jgi:VWFA-related protein
MKTKWFRYLLTLCLLALLLLSSVLTASAQGDVQVHITQVDNSRFPRVTVYVSVTDAAGEPVGVDANTLKISENGQPMQVVEVKGGGKGKGEPLTTMLVIDISGSMDKNGKIDAAKNAAKTYVSQTRSGDQAGLISYDTKVYSVQPITSDTAALTSAIDGLKTGSDTAMYDALREAVSALEGVSGRKAVIVLTDGLDNSSHKTADDVINSIGQGGLTISAIGFGDAGTLGQSGLDEEGLKSLANRAGGRYAFANDAQSLSAIYQNYGQALQSEYALTYVTPSTLRDGVNRGLTVSISASGATAQGKYNPGGVLPEISGRSWTLFGAIGLGLLVLLVVPLLLIGGGNILGGVGFKRKGRIKLAQPSTKARGRIKLR